MSERTDKALQEFLDSLSQLPGSIVYRGPHNWKGLAPGPEGHVLAMAQDNELQWRPAPSAGGRAMSSLNPFQWFDARDLSLSDGDPVTGMTDKGGRPYDLTARTGSPTYSANVPGVLFDGVDDCLSSIGNNATTHSQPITHVLVVEMHSGAGGEYLFDSDHAHGAGQRQLVSLRNVGGLFWRMYAATNQDALDLTLNQRQIIAACFNGDNSFFRINNNTLPVGNPGAEGHHGYTIGCNYTNESARYGNFTLHEVACTGKVTDTAHLDEVITDLANEWSISL